MSAKSLAQGIERWRGGRPLLGISPDADTRSLDCYIQGSEQLLAQLPCKAKRSHEESLRVQDIHQASRIVRAEFMDLHADWLYDSLARDPAACRTLSGLAFAASEHCPGLVPTVAQIAEESRKAQAEKEGYEIDQGIFFSALLRSPRTGMRILQNASQSTTRAVELFLSFRTGAYLNLGSVTVERHREVGYITMNYGQCLNAEDNRLVDDLETAVDLVLLDDAIRVGVLRGGVMTHPRYAGRRVFCAGINLKALRAGKISFVDFILRRELCLINKIMRGLFEPHKGNQSYGGTFALRRQKPWIAVLDAFAIGGGAQLLLACDCVIAGPDSYISLPAAREGIIPGFANLRLARFLGSRGARELILSGRRICARDINAACLIDEVVDAGEIDRTVERNAQRLASPATVVNRHMIGLAEEPVELMLHYAAEFALLQAERLYSQDVCDNVTQVKE